MRKNRIQPFAALLGGGDRRSIGETDAVVRAVAAAPARFDELFRCLGHADPLVRMRAADALEKATREDAAPLRRHKAALLDGGLEDGTAEVRWNLLRLAARIPLGLAEAKRMLPRLQAIFDTDKSRIARVMALQTACELAEQHPELDTAAQAMLHEAERSPAASLRARARLLAKARR